MNRGIIFPTSALDAQTQQLVQDGLNTFSEIFSVVGHVQLGAVIITIVSLLILIFWVKIPYLKDLKLVPPALVAVVVGVLLNEFFIQSASNLAVMQSHLVSLPVPTSIDEFLYWHLAFLVA